MDKRDGTKIERCPTCGSIVKPSIRVNKIMKDADAAMKRFTNKLKEKNATSKQTKR